MLEEARAGGGLAPSAFYPDNLGPASSSPLRVMEEEHPKILERYAVGPRAPVPRPAAARRISLILLSSIGAAVAFLLATCFRRLRSRGPAEGLQLRSLAGQQRWGAAVEEGGEEEAFLSQTLEGCLDLEVELGFAAPAPQPFPLPENDAVKSIVFSLQEAAMMFETQQASDGFLETSLSSTPQEAPQPLGLTAHANDQWSRQRTEAWQEGGGPLGAPLASVPTPPMPSHNGLQGVPTGYDLVYLQQQQRRPKSSEAAAAAAAESRVASRLPFFPEEENAHQPPSKKRMADAGGAVDQHSYNALLHKEPWRAQQQQQHYSPGAVHSYNALLNKGPWQAQQQQQHHSPGAVHSYNALLHKEPWQALQQQQHYSPGAAPAKSLAQGPSRLSGLFGFSYDGVASSSGEILPEMSLSTPQAAGHSEFPQASTSWQPPKSSADSRSASLQPGALEVSEGSISIVLETGEKITFPHPPIPTPPDTPLHYRLPLVPPEAVQTRFLTRAALSSSCCSGVWKPLSIIRLKLRKPVLKASEVTQVMAACQELLKYLLTKHTSHVINLTGFKALERLSMRYLCLEALVNCIQLIGPPMKPEEWFAMLVSSVPTLFVPTEEYRTPAALSNVRLISLLVEALIELKAGRRPSLKLTESIKKKVFNKKPILEVFRPPNWDAWREEFKEDGDSEPLEWLPVDEDVAYRGAS